MTESEIASATRKTSKLRDTTVSDMTSGKLVRITSPIPDRAYQVEIKVLFYSDIGSNEKGGGILIDSIIANVI